MAQVLQGGDGMMGGFPLEQWFYEMPVCTRWWMTAALSASVLQREGRVLQKPGTAAPLAGSFTVADVETVLAPRDNLLLLRSAITRPALPHLLPPAILAPPRRELWTLARALLVAPHICVDAAVMYCAHVQHGVPRFGAL
jgi:hypothetical protein